MSKSKLEGYNLPSLQKLVILHLAKSEPQTRNATANALSKEYKPTRAAFASLEKKKLIRTTEIKHYLNRDFPRYWLTDEGMITAMLEGINPTILLEETKKLFPERNMVHCFLEVAPLMNPLILRIAYSIGKGKGELEFKDIATILISQAGISMEIETLEKLVAVFKKYPEEHEKLKKLIQMTIDQLKQFVSE